MLNLALKLTASAIVQAIRNWLNFPDFYAPLTNSLVLTNGTGSATFTRATTATCWGYLESAIDGDSQVLLTIPAGIPRFQGARFLASNNTWSNIFSDGSAIPLSTLKGVMIETASTNLALRSQELDNAYWIKGANTAITANQITAPDGTLTADLITINGTDNSTYSAAITVTGSTSYTYSAYVKLGTIDISAYKIAGYDLTNSAFVFQDIVPTGVPNSSGWTRVTYSFTTPATCTSLRIYNNRNGASTNGTYYAWGAQLEAKPYASSYIPTTTAAVTRNADVLTFPNAGNVSDTAGTVLMEATPAFDIPNSGVAGYGRNAFIDFGAFNNGAIYTQDNSLRRFDGLNLIATPAWTPLKDTTYKIGSRYGSAGQRNWLNGTAGTNGAFDGSINSAANMTIGGYGGGATYNWGGTLKNVKIWKRALSDADITKGTT